MKETNAVAIHLSGEKGSKNSSTNLMMNAKNQIVKKHAGYLTKYCFFAFKQ